jgi:plastocyanin
MKLSRSAYFILVMLLPATVFGQAGQGTPAPASTVTISIVGSMGSAAFVPNPASVPAGAAVVWKNNDRAPHRIVLDNGAGDTGELRPGATSRPVTIPNTSPITFHCTIHPSMIGSINGSTPPTTSSQPSSYGYGAQTPEVGAHPSYPGIPPSQNKMEADIGPYKVRLYGTLLLNTSVSRGGIFGQDVPLWATSGNVTYPDGTAGHLNNTLIFTMRQSIVGFAVNPGQRSDAGWTPSALLEMDFFGTRPSDTVEPQDRVLNQPRLRLAYFQLEHGGVKLVFGQDAAILAPIDPISLSHVALPLGATAGDLWGWLPQARVDFRQNVGSTGLLFQVGILRPQFGDTPKLEAVPAASTSIDTGSSGLGERSAQPFYQARFAISPRIGGQTATLAISAHHGEEKIGISRNLPSSAVAFDGSVPVTRYAVVRGEAFSGRNLIPFQGAIQQGAAVLVSPVSGAPPLQIQAIGAKGGWGELTILPTGSGKEAIYVGAGTDRPKIADLLPGSTRVENTFLWASYFHKLNDAVTIAVEWSNWQFRTVTFTNNIAGPPGPPSKANIVNVSVGYQF